MPSAGFIKQTKHSVSNVRWAPSVWQVLCWFQRCGNDSKTTLHALGDTYQPDCTSRSTATGQNVQPWFFLISFEFINNSSSVVRFFFFIFFFFCRSLAVGYLLDHGSLSSGYTHHKKPLTDSSFSGKDGSSWPTHARMWTSLVFCP